MQLIDMGAIIPQDHLVRKIDAVIDFDFIRPMVKELYSEDNGRPSIDPVVLVKIIFIQFLFGIRSMRQTIKEIEVNPAYAGFWDWELPIRSRTFRHLEKTIPAGLRSVGSSKKSSRKS
ncbi:MAG: transposase [Bacillus subtilis]|nr:transposase [Bacillus subtilis]